MAFTADGDISEWVRFNVPINTL